MSVVRYLGMASLAAASLMAGQLKPGFNAGEALAWNDASLENRFYLNGSLACDPITASVHSTNILQDADPATYFGSHRAGIGSSKFRIIGTARTIAGQSVQYGAGLRYDKGLPGSTYGYVEMTMNSTARSLQVLSGYAGRYGSAEFTFNLTDRSKGRDSAWAELQLNAGGKRVQPFLLAQYDTKTAAARVAAGLRVPW